MSFFSKGCFIWNKLRPMDQMCFALIESNGPNSDLVRMFFNKIYSVCCDFNFKIKKKKLLLIF